MKSPFGGGVVAEAPHAGGRSLDFEPLRVSILARRHMLVEIARAERWASRDVQRRAVRQPGCSTPRGSAAA